MPTSSVNRVLKVPSDEQPASKHTSATLRVAPAGRAIARSIAGSVELAEQGWPGRRRNNVSAVLRRVEAGAPAIDRQRSTSGRSDSTGVQAELHPLGIIHRGQGEWRADPALAQELAELLPETTDDVLI